MRRAIVHCGLTKRYFRKSLSKIFKEIDKMLKVKKVDLIIGGPPFRHTLL
jgi:hypothetical protein